MTKSECEEYLLNIPKFKKKTLLSDTERFYEAIGAPAKDIPIIHVAGTNGKGSTCYYISEILEEHNLKTALFTSPHLVSMNERFVCDRKYIDDASFTEAFETVKNGCLLFDEEEKLQIHPSFFEFLFLMFMVWAEKERPDVIVLETGLGGRLDATNIFRNPSLTVICSIGIDHIEQLGGTIEEIAYQKAGIIQKGVPLILWDNGPKVNEVIEKVATDMDAKVYKLCDSAISSVHNHENHIDFLLNFEYDTDVCARNLKVGLPTNAMYQTINSSMAVLAAKVFLKERFDDSAAMKAVGGGTFKGRLQEIADGFYVDGAHNEDAVQRLLETVDFIDVKTLIFGACKDKDFRRMLEMISDAKVFDNIILTSVNSARAADAKELKEALKEYDGNVFETDNLSEAVCISERYEGKTVIAGSLYLVGEAIALLEKA